MLTSLSPFLQAFRTNAQNILSEGMLTPEKMERLTKLREQLGLTEEMANAVIRSISASKMVTGVDSAIASGKLTIKDVRGFRESGVDIDSMVSFEGTTWIKTLFIRKGCLNFRAFLPGGSSSEVVNGKPIIKDRTSLAGVWSHVKCSKSYKLVCDAGM